MGWITGVFLLATTSKLTLGLTQPPVQCKAARAWSWPPASV